MGALGLSSPSVAAPTGISGTAEEALSAFDSSLRIPGTSWKLDESTGQVVVNFDEEVTGDELAQLAATTAPFGAAVRTEAMPGVLRMTMKGGQPIYGNGTIRCTLGFNVIKDGVYYFITAAHCLAGLNENWYARNDKISASFLGHVVSKRLGGPHGEDFGLVRYDSATAVKSGTVDLHDGGAGPIPLS